MCNEHYEFRLVRSDDKITEVITLETDGNSITHDSLAEMFNKFLTASGYVGHNYIDFPK